jgi:hypothetical protein
METNGKNGRRVQRALAAVVLAFAALAGKPAMAIDVDAGDYTALPAGTNLGLLYYQHVERDRIYAGGNQVSAGSLDSDVGIARYVHYMKLGNFTVDPQFLLPFGTLRGTNDLRALGNTTGVGDLILAATVWVLNDPERKRYLGITPFVYVPTGSYSDNRALNLGENRWKFALQAGYITPLVGPLTLDLIGDVTVFGRNTDYTAAHATKTENPLVQVQAWLRYNVTDTFDVRAGVSDSMGGLTRVNGVSQGDRINTSKFSVGFALFPAKTWQVLGTYGNDISVHNGPMESTRVNLRVMKIF